MDTSEKAYAKLNLSLDVTEKRPDGYHEMLTVMQSFSLADEITLRPSKKGGVTSRSNLSWLPDDGRNLANRAAELFFEETGVSGWGMRLDIEKRIPVCAGLGGGSADAAAVLRAMNVIFDTGLERAELERLGSMLGSDVPFCVAGGTSLCTGRGERLLDLPPFPDCHIVVCKPPFSVSTKELFEKLDTEKIRLRPDTKGLMDAIVNGNLRGASLRMYNVFEICFDRWQRKEIDKIKNSLLDGGALGASVSGTGPSVFGVFADEAPAVELLRELRSDYTECFLAEPVGKIPV